MSDFARFCNKCYVFFRDPDLFASHVEVCGVAKKTADDRQQTTTEPRKTAGGRKQAVEKEKMADSKPQTIPENGVSGTTNVDNPPASAAACFLPTAVSTEGDMPPADISPPVKTSKFKT